MTEEGQPGRYRDYEKLMMLLEETEEAGVLVPYYDTSYGQYFLDRWVARLLGEEEVLLWEKHDSVFTLLLSWTGVITYNFPCDLLLFVCMVVVLYNTI